MKNEQCFNVCYYCIHSEVGIQKNDNYGQEHCSKNCEYAKRIRRKERIAFFNKLNRDEIAEIEFKEYDIIEQGEMKNVY